MENIHLIQFLRRDLIVIDTYNVNSQTATKQLMSWNTHPAVHAIGNRAVDLPI